MRPPAIWIWAIVSSLSRCRAPSKAVLLRLSAQLHCYHIALEADATTFFKTSSLFGKRAGVCRSLLKLRHDILFGESRLEHMPRYRLTRQARIVYALIAPTPEFFPGNRKMYPACPSSLLLSRLLKNTRLLDFLLPSKGGGQLHSHGSCWHPLGYPWWFWLSSTDLDLR